LNRNREESSKQSEVPTNTSCKRSDVNVPDVDILEENEYEEIRGLHRLGNIVEYLSDLPLYFVDISIKSSPSVAAKKQTPEVTYCNTSGKDPTTLDNSVSDGNPAVS
jgi:hypothetical protein